MRNRRTAQQEFVRCIDPGFDEQPAIVAELHLAVSERRVVADDADQVSERIDIEEGEIAAVQILLQTAKFRRPGRTLLYQNG